MRCYVQSVVHPLVSAPSNHAWLAWLRIATDFTRCGFPDFTRFILEVSYEAHDLHEAFALPIELRVLNSLVS